MKQKFIYFLIIVMALAFVYLKFSQRGNITTPLPPPLTPPRAGGENRAVSPPFSPYGGSPVGGQGGVRGGYLIVGDVEVFVEIADTPEKQRQGLSGHGPLLDKQGMFFPMDRAGQHSFWMKDMKFPLDILWIRNNKIIDISNNVPAPTGDEMPVTVRPKELADAVLELNADFTEKYGIQIGDATQGANPAIQK